MLDAPPNGVSLRYNPSQLRCAQSARLLLLARPAARCTTSLPTLQLAPSPLHHPCLACAAGHPSPQHGALTHTRLERMLSQPTHTSHAGSARRCCRVVGTRRPAPLHEKHPGRAEPQLKCIRHCGVALSSSSPLPPSQPIHSSCTAHAIPSLSPFPFPFGHPYRTRL
jgi:hypothetical protein